MVEDEEILTEFLLESQENLARLDEEMVKLERDPANGPLLSSVFRTIHTIKGTCGFLGFSHLEGISHRAENLLSEVRGGEQPLTPELVSAILNAVDAIKGELSIIQETGNESDRTQADLLALLESLSCAGSKKAEATAASVPKAPLPIAAVAVANASIAASSEDKKIAIEPPEAKPIPAETPGAHANEMISGEWHPETKNMTGAAAIDTTVRLDVAFLDSLVNLVGELVLARNEIAKLSARAEKPYQVSSQRLNSITTELQGSIMKTRMQPVGSAWGKIPRVVRDLAKTCGKQIKLEMKGAETELDRAVVDAIRDPLIHIVRNSCDHGIESPQVRLDRGKPSEGTLLLKAFHANGQVHIEISDDGGGVDPARVKRKAVSSGLLSERDAAALSDKEAILLICHAGFSTAETVTNISGRGVGMDVVKTSIEKIGGLLDLQSELGKGTSIKIRIPLTLAIIPGVLVASGGERFIMPQRNLIEVLRVERRASSSPVEVINQTPVLHWRDYILPLLNLSELLRLPAQDSDVLYIAVLQGEEQLFGLLLDYVEDTQEIVVKPLDPQLKSIASFAGATVLGDGEVCLILDVNGILRHAGLDGAITSPARKEAEVSTEPRELALLCQVGEDTEVALSLSYVDRLEVIPLTVLQHASRRLVMQYRGGVLPLVKLNELLGLPERYDEDSDSFALLVFRNRQRSVGFVVRKVMDIVSEEIPPQDERDHSLSYPAIIGGKTVDILNCRSLLEQFDSSWFEGETSDVEPSRDEDLAYA